MKKTHIEEGRNYLELRKINNQTLMGISRDKTCGEWDYFLGEVYMPRILGPSEVDFRFLSDLVTRVSSTELDNTLLRKKYNKYLSDYSGWNYFPFLIGSYDTPIRYHSPLSIERNKGRDLDRVSIELTKDPLHFIELFKQIKVNRIFNRVDRLISARESTKIMKQELIELERQFDSFEVKNKSDYKKLRKINNKIKALKKQPLSGFDFDIQSYLDEPGIKLRVYKEDKEEIFDFFNHILQDK